MADIEMVAGDVLWVVGEWEKPVFVVRKFDTLDGRGNKLVGPGKFEDLKIVSE